jgi:hypothetical protein
MELSAAQIYRLVTDDPGRRLPPGRPASQETAHRESAHRAIRARAHVGHAAL